MTRSKKILAGALVTVGALVAAIALHFGMAYNTLGALNDARLRGDAAAFSAHVDYPALRASFKATMGANLDATAEATPAIVRPMVQAMNRAILGTLTDHLITPQGVAQIMAQGKVPTARQVDEQGQPVKPSPATGVADVDSTPTVRTHFRGFSTLATTYEDGHGRLLTLLVKAEGPFDWKLAGIEIPVPDAIKAAIRSQLGASARPLPPASSASAVVPKGASSVPAGVASEAVSPAH